MISPQTQFKIDTTAIRTYLKTNDISAIKLPSGVWYTLESTGLGILPVLTDSVKISYKTKLIPSKDLIDQKTNYTFLVSSIIAGLQQTLLYFPAGSSGKIYVPSGLAFGTTTNSSSIPSNANLIYEVTVDRVLNTLTGSVYRNDQSVISTYISDTLARSGYTLRRDSISGIQYAVAKLGSGPRPVLSDLIQVTYTEKILHAAKPLVTINTPVELELRKQINGLRNVLPIIRQGSRVIILVPSGFAYGNVATTTIPANSILQFDLTLIRVIHN